MSMLKTFIQRLIYVVFLLFACCYSHGLLLVTSVITESCQSQNETVTANSSVTLSCCPTVNYSDVFFRWERYDRNTWKAIYSTNKLNKQYNSKVNVTIDATNHRSFLQIYSVQTTDAGIYKCSTYDRSTMVSTAEEIDLTVIDGDLNRSCSIQPKISLENHGINVTCSVTYVGNAIPSIECPYQAASFTSNIHSALSNETTDSLVRTLYSTITINEISYYETISCSLLSSNSDSTHDKLLYVWNFRGPSAESEALLGAANNVVIVAVALSVVIVIIIVIVCMMRKGHSCLPSKSNEDQLFPQHGRQLHAVAYDGRGESHNWNMNSFGVMSWGRHDAINHRMQQAASANNVGRQLVPSAPSLNESELPTYTGYHLYDDVNTANAVSVMSPRVHLAKSTAALNRLPGTAAVAGSTAAADDVYADVSVVPGLAEYKGRQQRQPQREPAFDASLYAAIDHTMTIDFKNVI